MKKYPQESVKPYNEDEKNSVQVERMFDNIAPAYDQLNHTLSWGIDKSWRKKAINWLKPFQPQRMMDVATGTGDFAIQACRVLNPKELIGTDISEGMMNVGRQKVKDAGLEGRISFAKEDCTALTFPDNRFDAITVAFGVRNFEDLDKGLREIHSVLDTNGKLVILELSEPDRFPMKQLSKEFVREWLLDNGFQGKEGQQVHEMTEEIVNSISERYMELFESITGEKFEKADVDSIAERIERNVTEYLK